MGNVMSNLGLSTKRGLKRKKDECDDSDASGKNKRLKTTSEFIFNAYFVNGEGSDITITALGKEWHLHKIHLKQCAYFQSMFNGSWRESDTSFLNMEMPDPLITVEALNIAFKCVYKDDVKIPKCDVVSVLAAATLLQLDGLREKCRDIMRSKLEKTTVISFYSAAQSYGLQDIVDLTFDWLLQNIMNQPHMPLLRDISTELMPRVIAAHNLCVLYIEMDVYSMLKKWVFTQQFPDLANSNDSDKLVNRFFSSRVKFATETTPCFLETDEGRPYIPAFQAVRWQTIISHPHNLVTIRTDRIVSEVWLHQAYRYNWEHLLAIDSGLDKGPTDDINEVVFNQVSFRYGRILVTRDKHYWRWVGYNHGIDLLVHADNGVISLKRNTTNPPVPVSHQPLRTIAFRLNLASLDKSGNCRYLQTTGLQVRSLDADKEDAVMLISPEIIYPITLSFNMMTFSPSFSSVKPYLDVPKRNTHISTQTDDITIIGCSQTDESECTDNDDSMDELNGESNKKCHISSDHSKDKFGASSSSISTQQTCSYEDDEHFISKYDARTSTLNSPSYKTLKFTKDLSLSKRCSPVEKPSEFHESESVNDKANDEDEPES